ncbi:MAG: hypothetical protein RI556_05540 [Hydrogenovibrio sp.]|uniref:hypothetical protein n=1 Tax=Hydrogenovibrio sp. TaxID=2065821 RepID=UPI00287010D1|nr:hypothetical protein [Hydrogenovibrio sp.]MDR9498617.1 hypothetical protein [Hydrogenovibrio sp.]
MAEKRTRMSWHYYAMALGVLLGLMAATLAAWGSMVSGFAFAILCHPLIPFKGLTRGVFLTLFAILYVFAFPDPDVVREMMNA